MPMTNLFAGPDVSPSRIGRHIGNCIAASAVFLCALVATGQQRPPAVPLITHDPYFSIWSAADRLTDHETTHWTGPRQPIAGLARIDGTTFRFMGAHPKDVPAMEQVSLSVTATHTL